MSKKRRLLLDELGNPIQIMSLSSSHDVDGTSASAQSEVIDGDIVRISAVNADIRFLIGQNPVALSTSHYLALGCSIEQPIAKGNRVAILGGIANIATVGE